jgi:hypothetical protein
LRRLVTTGLINLARSASLKRPPALPPTWFMLASSLSVDRFLPSVPMTPFW